LISGTGRREPGNRRHPLALPRLSFVYCLAWNKHGRLW